MTVKYAPELERDCAICGGRYFDLPGAIRAHRVALGHQPRCLVPPQHRPAARCAACGGPIDPHSGECRCST